MYLDVVADADSASAVPASVPDVEVVEREAHSERRRSVDHPVTTASVRVQSRIVGTRQRPGRRRQHSSTLCT